MRRLRSCFGVLLCAALLWGCSESRQATSTSGQSADEVVPFAVTSPIRFANLDAATLIVCDYDSAAVILLNKASLEVTGGFQVRGKPIGAVHASGRYFVANRTAQSVDVYSEEGEFLYAFGSGDGAFQQVNDLAHDAALALIYVLDAKAALVRVFDYDGQEAAYTVGAGTLVHPTALCVDPSSGEILVSDFGNHDDIGPQVFLFDSSGNVVSPMAASAPVVSPMMGMGWPPPPPASGFSGNFSTPQGLFVGFPSGARTLYLVDARAGQVQGYNLTDGTQVVSLGSLGTEAGQLFYPLDVYVDGGSGDVFVADHRNRRVSVYREGGGLP